MRLRIAGFTMDATLALLTVLALLAVSCASGNVAQPTAARESSISEPTKETTALNEGGAAEEAESEGPDSVVIAQGDDAITLDPAKHSSVPTNNVLKHLFDSLVYVDGENNVLPALALSWETLDDVTWQFELREGVTFHDGSAFTAEAVKFTYERTLNPETASPTATTLNAIERVEVVDDYTVNIVTKQPFPLLLYHIVDWGGMILSPEYVQSHDADYLASNPVGTGPYRLVEYVRDERIVLEAFSDYWGEEPEVKRVTFRPVPEASTRVAGLLSGDLDLVTNLPPENIAELEGRDDTRVDIVPSGYVAAVWINTMNGGPMADKRVRQALNHAIDVEAIIEGIFLGNAVHVSITGVPSYFGYDTSLEPYTYDPDRARELLTEAGYPDGFSVTLLSMDGITLKDKEAADALVGYLEAVGIQTERQVVPLSRLIEMAGAKEFPELVYSGWRSAWPDMDALYYPLLCCGQFFASNFYQNPELDELILGMRSTLDQDRRQEMAEEAMSMVYEEAPHIFLFQLTNIYGVRNDLQWHPKSDTNTEMWSASFR